MNTKKWYESRTVWFNIIVTITGVISVLQNMDEYVAYTAIFTPILVIGNTILRVWFTETKIEK